ncbi:LOW QUALITY PROTEIN: CCR4-NOT transcription complex subunit 4-like [Amphiura filiformis]|uniref:LOW QUALITY PROTEIN: CCR4-NOT transcription complex subunit 4-like n=1 Tax=Amphiura filiformis TaxID=82378 RepID=UPI003B21F367
MMHNEDPVECPLCMEPLEMDDINFYPCTCGYQICRFCWHRIRTDENGLCPACRKAYQECPADFKPLSEEELQRIKNEKKQKDQQRKQKISENRKHLASVRVVQKNLVFVVGLSQRLADQEVLKKQEYFGKFGKIIKVVINQNTSYAGSQGPSASAYVTYQRAEDALRAIQAVNNVHVDGRTLKASLGTTKYCSHFLKNAACPKPDCMYLHELGDEAASFTKEDMQMGKHQEYEQKLLSDLFGGGTSSATATTSNPQQSATAITTAATNTSNSSNSTQNSQQSSVFTQQQTELNRSSPTDITTARKKSPSPPITTNHNNIEAWPSLQREGDTGPNTPDEKSQSPTVETANNTAPPVGNHMGDRTFAGIRYRCSRLPSSSSNHPTSRSPFESHENSSFFSANGFLPQILGLGLGGPPPLIPPGPPPNLPPPPQPHPANDLLSLCLDWSEGLVLSNDLPPVNSQTDWQAAFGFGSELKDKQNAEDDLGFDPWNESSKGLADLLEKELQLGTSPAASSQVTQPPPGFNPSPFNHTLGFGIRPPPQSVPADASGSKMFQWMQNKPPRLPTGHPAHMSSLPPPFQPGMGIPPPPGQHPPFPGAAPPLGYPNHTPRVPPPLGTGSLSSNPQSESVNIESWQEGLRALLPNINISFGVPFTQQQIATQHSADTWSGNQSSWNKHNDPAIISINSNSLNTGSTTTGGTAPTSNSYGIGGGLLDKDGEEQPPHWLESLQTLTEPEESPTHSNHLFPSHQHNNRGPSWTTHAPPPGLHPQIRPNSQTTEPHTLTENL